MTTIQQILDWPLEYKSGGFTLHIITAKKRKQVGDKWIQRATLSDGQNEILASFVLHKNNPLPHNSPIHITHCKRTELDVNNKSVQAITISEWELPTMTADEWENEDNTIAVDWKKDQNVRIRGMCRHGIVCAMIHRIPASEQLNLELNISQKQQINKLVDFIMTGK